MRNPWLRPIAGLATILTFVAIIAVAAGLFRGSFTRTVPLTVLSPRAGLVMNPDAKVRLRGVEIGTVSSIDVLPDGQAALRLAIDPSRIDLIPANVEVEIASPTVFGAKFVALQPPPDPSPQSVQPDQVLDSRHVTVEINTVFQQLTSLLSKIDPTKLNATLAALNAGLGGRGEKFGRSLVDFDSLLTKIEPGLDNLTAELATAPKAFNAYADAAPDLLRTADNATRISQTIVDQQQNLDTLLISTIGLADTGNDVVGSNRKAITDVLHLLVPTTDLTSQYHQGLYCVLAGMATEAKGAPAPVPGVYLSDAFVLAQERYRFPQDLPKVAATGDPQCMGLPTVGVNQYPPYLVTDVGLNPHARGNQGILLNSDALKQFLFGPVDGPPRNTAQVGQPG